jgi:hypothetical protein
MKSKPAIEWADILGPAREFEAAVTKTRSLKDLPAVSAGAKEIALLSIFKEEQRFAFEPVMRALQSLKKLEDWSHSYFVADRTMSTSFDWRQMPLRQYSSFEDFYHQELEETWGKWETLQATYARVIKGELTEEQGRQLILGKHGGDRRSGAVKDQVGNTKLISDGGTTRAYILARLDRDGHHELAAKVRAGELSANAAAIEAGFRKKRIRRCPKCGHEW